MVSGLVTSPWDQLRIFSGEASEMRIESKSAIRFARSYGDERYIYESPCCPRQRRAEFLISLRRQPPQIGLPFPRNILDQFSKLGHFASVLFHYSRQCRYGFMLLTNRLR